LRAFRPTPAGGETLPAMPPARQRWSVFWLSSEKSALEVRRFKSPPTPLVTFRCSYLHATGHTALLPAGRTLPSAAT
jgi:hypothetical protein